jgi:pimeloyl-ACP methyl ester carboxylesterase
MTIEESSFALLFVKRRYSMACFVLVHGGFFGGWCWKKIAPKLRSKGHEVYTPTLTGFGERSHLLNREIGLSTHVEDIVNVILFEGLYDVILLGHSYSGMVIGSVVDRIPDRIGHLIYLDAFVPEHGKSMSDIQSNRSSNMFKKMVDENGDGWMLQPLSPDSDTLGVTDKEDVQWLRSKLTPLPYRTLIEPAVLTNPEAGNVSRTFIYCTEKTSRDSFESFAQRTKIDPGWRYRELHTGHSAMITAPNRLSEELFFVLKS